jgi:membrane protease YdiL (CAAX protease family)
MANKTKAKKKPAKKSPDLSSKLAWLAIPFVVLIYFASQFVAGLAISIYAGLRGMSGAQAQTWLSHNIAANFAVVVVAYGLMLLFTYWLIKYVYHRSFQWIGLTRPKWRDIGYAVLGAIGYYILYLVLLSIAMQFIPELNAGKQQQIGFSSAHGAVQLVATFIAIGLLPPLVEEILMRGFLFTSLRSRLPFVIATLITSILFASAHLPEAASGLFWVGAIDTFILSLVLCFLREKTGRLWSGMGVHLLKNSLAFVLLFFLHVG